MVNQDADKQQGTILITDHTYLKYTKKTLNTAYLTEKQRSKILKTIQQVIFEKETTGQ